MLQVQSASSRHRPYRRGQSDPYTSDESRVRGRKSYAQAQGDHVSYARWRDAGAGRSGGRPSGGFAHGGWSVKYWDDRLDQEMTEFMGRPFDMLLGRKTYEIFAAYWPRSTAPGADALNSARKHVASTTLRSADWNNSTLIKGDVGAYVANLKKESGPEIQVHGSGRLIQTLLKNDLVDEFHLMVFPIALGSGKRLFAEGHVPAACAGVDCKT